MARYEVQDWDADYGIYDTQERKFIGQPITMRRDANIVCAWYNDLKESEAQNDNR